MRRWWLGLMVLPFLGAPIGCAGQQQGSSDVCPMIKPEVCPKGCFWNGKECRKDSGVIIWDAKGDAGANTTGSDASAGEGQGVIIWDASCNCWREKKPEEQTIEKN